ncbi:VTT domain-containing protein [Peptococcaceae bacterium 1198_IL3148]
MFAGDLLNIANLISENSVAAALTSIALNVFISVIGVIPSFFLTATNIIVFGIHKGFLVSWLGEVTGAVISLLLYRWGIKSFNRLKPEQVKIFRLINQMTTAKQLYFLSLLRMAPFIPSGLINLFGALTTVSLIVFLLATALGKLPALMIEVALSYNLVTFDKNYIYFFITVFITALLYWGLKKEIQRLEKT